MAGSHGHFHLLSNLAGFGQDQHGATCDIYCTSKQAKNPGRKTRGISLDGQSDQKTDALQGLAKHVNEGLQTDGEGPIELEEGVTFEHLAHTGFARFRQSLGVSEENYKKSMLNLTGGVTQASGKSGSIFWFSQDRRYVMKSVAEGEIDKLLDMLPRYADHFADTMAAGRPCLMSRFYAAYRLVINESPLYLTVMNDVFGGRAPPLKIYDLKGTTEDRYVDPAPNKVMKDLNFSNHLVEIPENQVDAFLEAVEADSEFLKSEDIMDYSLLVGVEEGHSPTLPKDSSSTMFRGAVCIEHDEDEDSDDDDGEVDKSQTSLQPATFSVGIIDILISWTLKKKLAYILKKPTIGCCHEIDTEPPDVYQSRFAEYFNQKVRAYAVHERR